MSLESIESRLTPLLPRLGSVNAKVKIVVDKTDIIHLDATQKPAIMTFSDGPADCTIKMSPGQPGKTYRRQDGPHGGLCHGPAEGGRLQIRRREADRRFWLKRI